MAWGAFLWVRWLYPHSNEPFLSWHPLERPLPYSQFWSGWPSSFLVAYLMQPPSTSVSPCSFFYLYEDFYA
jgi:hypothetical protein